jgi:RNA polymerase sigma factor (sigma-70 family)
MATGPMRGMLRHLRRASGLRDAAELADGPLLERFLARRDEAAFEALVKRHGPMVLGVCRRVLGNHADAEDAFQATFLVLVRKGHTVRPRGLVGNWLHGVAYRTALRARSAAALRRAKERQVPPMPPTEPPSDNAWRDVQPLLDRELNGLPEKYRAPIVLCDLQGKTRREAARALGWPEGTLSCRLARGRALLARRLARNGIPFIGAALAVGLAQEAAAAVPALLTTATTRTALAGAASAGVMALAEGVIKAMLWTRLKIGAALVLALGVFVGGSGAFRISAGAGPGAAAAGKTAAAAAAGKAPRKPQAVRGNDDAKDWKLDFRFHDPQLAWVRTSGRGLARYWYLRYEVVNRTPEAHLFIPNFELVLPGQTAGKQDQVLPGVFEELVRREDPAGWLKLRNSANITAESIPPPGPDGMPRAVHGLAIWPDVSADVQGFTLYVAGLTNRFRVEEVQGLFMLTWTSGRREELRLRFRREGDAMRFVPPAEWIFRAQREVAPPTERKDEETKRLELYYRHLGLAQAEWERYHKAAALRKDAVQKAVRQIDEGLRDLRRLTDDERAEMEALDEIERALKDLRWQRQDQRKEREKLQGLWVPKKLEFGATAVPPELWGGTLSPPSAVAILGDRFLTRAGKDPRRVPTIRLDPHSKPARIEFHIGGQIHRATYELQGDTLRIRLGDSTLTYRRQKL